MRLLTIFFLLMTFYCPAQLSVPDSVFNSNGVIITEDHSKNNSESMKALLQEIIVKKDSISVGMELPYWYQERINSEFQSSKPNFKFLNNYLSNKFQKDFIRKLEFISLIRRKSGKHIKVFCYDRCGLDPNILYDFLKNYRKQLSKNSNLNLAKSVDTLQNKIKVNDLYDLYDTLLVDFNENKTSYKEELNDFRGFSLLMKNIGSYLVTDTKGDTYISSRQSEKLDSFRENFMEEILTLEMVKPNSFKLILMGAAHVLKLNSGNINPCGASLSRNFNLPIIIQEYEGSKKEIKFKFEQSRDEYYYLTNGY